MINEFPRTLPAPLKRFLTNAVGVLSSDPRVVGVAAGGSFITDTMDEFSDLDLVIVGDASGHPGLLADRVRLAESLGSLLAAFSGEHVAEPRLLVCLYEGEHPLHVDLKFVSVVDLAVRVENPVVLWERDAVLTRALSDGAAAYPPPSYQWIEDRFWVWVHYATSKVGRGELFEAHDFLAYLRGAVLGPLALARAGLRPSGVRHLERLPAGDVDLLRGTVAGMSREEAIRALRASISAYRALRPSDGSVLFRAAAERAAMSYLEHVEASAA